MSTGRQVLVASNRGPASFSLSADGALTLRRGGGGLVSGLAGVASDPATDLVWVCGAPSGADRAAVRQAKDGRLDLAGHDLGGAAVQVLDIPAATFERAYNAVANSTLWFVHHMLYDTPSQPSFGPAFRREWESFRSYNSAFAAALAKGAIRRNPPQYRSRP